MQGFHDMMRPGSRVVTVGKVMHIGHDSTETTTVLAFLLLIHLAAMGGLGRINTRKLHIVRNLGSVLALASTLLAFLGYRSRIVNKDLDHAQKCVDADLAGAGIKLGVYVSVTYLVLEAIGGIFQKGVFGNKNFGSGLVGLTGCLEVAMLLQLRAGNLSFGDAVVGTIMLDMQAIALLALLGMKDVLRARWFVAMLMISAGCSLFVMGDCMSRVSCVQSVSNRAE